MLATRNKVDGVKAHFRMTNMDVIVPMILRKAYVV